MERGLYRILLIEDDEDDYLIIKDMLSEPASARFKLDWAQTYEAGLEALCCKEHDVYLLDYRLGERNGLEFLHEALQGGCEAPIIFLTGQGDYELDVAAMRAGAEDYLVKGQIRPDLLERSIRYAIERKRSETELKRYRDHLEELVRERTLELSERTEQLERTNSELQHEINERRRAEEALRESESRYRLLVENSLDIVYTIDSEGNISLLNPAFEKITGWAAKEWVGRSFAALIHPEDLALVQNRVQRALQGETLPAAEARVASRSGAFRWLEFKSVPNTGGPEGLCLLGTARDVTERKHMEEELRRARDELEQRVRERTADLARSNEALRAEIARRRFIEQALRESEEKYRELVENANSIILRWDAEGNILFFNEFAQSFFGYSREEILGKSILGTIIPETDSSGRDLRAIVRDLLRDPDRFYMHENENMRRNGDRVLIYWTNRAIKDSRGRVQGVLSVGTDITELRRAEKALREAESLAAMGRALSSVAHDIKTPLIAIGGFTRLVQRHLARDNPDREKLGIVLRETERLEHMVKDMLDFSRPLELERSLEEIPRVVEESLAVVNPMAQERGILIQSRSSEPLPRASIDSMRMKQVIINLVMNAIQASPPGQTVTVDCHRNGSHLVIDVSDCGCGIPVESRETIFSPFFTTKKEGTGLGLPIVRKIVEAHQGLMEILDNPGAGVTFRVILPSDHRDPVDLQCNAQEKVCAYLPKISPGFDLNAP